MLRITILILTGSLLAVTCATTASQNNPGRGPAEDLRVTLAADRDSLQPGEEIRLTAEFANRGNKPFRILEDTCFAGNELEMTDSHGKPVAARAGFTSFSPKTGLFLGRTRLLGPGEKMIIALHAYLDAQGRLVFAFPEAGENLAGRIPDKSSLGLPVDYPDKYIGCGKIFLVEKPGSFAISWRYQKAESDRHWRFPKDVPAADRSLENLWTGTVVSNTVIVTLRK
jgi:hypothetical protein